MRGPVLLGLSVFFVFLNGEDVEVRESRGFCGCRDSGGLLIAIVHLKLLLSVDVWTFIARTVRAMGG